MICNLGVVGSNPTRGSKLYHGTTFFMSYCERFLLLGRLCGSVTILGDLTIHANNFATLNKKNFTSATPLKLALNFFILALNDSAFALVSLSSKKLRILS